MFPPNTVITNVPKLQNFQNRAYFCKDLEHGSEIASLCYFIIDACVTPGLNCFYLHGRWAEICLVGPNRLDLNVTGHFSGTGYGVNLLSLEVVLFIT